MTRELTVEQTREQAIALAEYIRRGGSGLLWMYSKQFLPADRAAILTALADLDQETELPVKVVNT